MNQFMLSVLVLVLTSSVWAKDITVSVKGMVCGFCAQGIEKKFKSLPDVDSVAVSLEKKTVLIKPKENKEVSNDVITQILMDSGYNIDEIKR